MVFRLGRYLGMDKRFWAPVNLAQFSELNSPLRVGGAKVCLPSEEQKVLRVLVDAPHTGLRLPTELEWTRPLIAKATQFQARKVGVRHPFTYVTVRHGVVDSTTDDAWHVDGFSTKITHLPEANYITVFGGEATEWVDQTFDFPSDFDPLSHNVHLFIQRRVRLGFVRQLEAGQMYFMDPYVAHRRPPAARGHRTFIRISFTPIEIPDVNNTPNPLIPTPHYIVDGIKGFRNQLLDYDLAA